MSRANDDSSDDEFDEEGVSLESDDTSGELADEPSEDDMPRKSNRVADEEVEDEEESSFELQDEEGEELDDNDF
jgi:hypothetical protein